MTDRDESSLVYYLIGKKLCLSHQTTLVQSIDQNTRNNVDFSRLTLFRKLLLQPKIP